MRLLYITSEWPSEQRPWAAPFIVRQVGFLREAGLDVDVFSFQGRRRPGNYLAICRRLQRKLQEESYDIVHAQFGHSGLLASAPKHAPLVVTFQGTDLHGIYTSAGHYHPISYPLRLMMQWVALRADAVIVVSEHLARFLWRKDYFVIPGGLDLTLFRPLPRQEARRQLGLPLDEKIVLFVGSPENPVKQYPLAQEVMAELDVPARLLVVNEVLPEQMPLYLNAGNALLVTSKHEGSPNAVKEALACNLPIVSVDVGDVQERLREVRGCRVVTSRRPAFLATALAEVLQDHSHCHGRPSVLELDEALMVQRQVQVYEEAIESYSRRPGHPPYMARPGA